jgi:hypothetical protein
VKQAIITVVSLKNSVNQHFVTVLQPFKGKRNTRIMKFQDKGHYFMLELKRGINSAVIVFLNKEPGKTMKDSRFSTKSTVGAFTVGQGDFKSNK